MHLKITSVITQATIKHEKKRLYASIIYRTLLGNMMQTALKDQNSSLQNNYYHINLDASEV